MALSKQEISKIHEDQKRVLFYGTEENGYADSGIWEFLTYVYTKDSHDSLNPVKRLIGPGDEYIIVVILHMLAFNDLCIPKSRQVRMSWVAAAFVVWHTMSARYRLSVWQSKKETDANSMVSMGAKNPCDGRLDFIIQHLPAWLRDPNVVSGRGNLVGSIVLEQAEESNGIPVLWRGSKINGIPQGGDQVRQYTLSLLIEDEAAFQDEYMSARVAAKPAITGGGKMISLSSVDAGSGFNQTVLDVSGDIIHVVADVIKRGLAYLNMKWPKGMRSWETRAGIQVLEVSYTADPMKDPERKGAAWELEALKGYVGGRESSGWKTEMLIDYNAGGGDPVFPQLYMGCPVFIDGFKPADIMENHRFVAGYDYGSSSPSAFIVWAINEDSQIFAVWELYEKCRNIAKHVEAIKRCPYWDKIEAIICDPSIMSKTQQGAADIKTLSERFEAHGLYLDRGRRGQDFTIAQEFNSSYWADVDNPDAFITKACPNLAKEVIDLRKARHISEAVNVRKNAPEGIRDKNNHAWDATALVVDSGLIPFTPEAKIENGYTMNKLKEAAGIREKKRHQTSGGIHIA